MRFIGIYGINALSFSMNVAAIFVYSRLGGAVGYGTYGIYVVFMSLYTLVDTSVLKAALAISSVERRSTVEHHATSASLHFIRRAIAPIVLCSAGVVFVGDYLFPKDGITSTGGTLIALIAVAEYLLSYPSTRLSFDLVSEGRFTALYSWRLVGTVLRHIVAWTTLLATGSILAAIAAIVIKGLIFGLGSHLWRRRRYSMPNVAPARIDMRPFGMLAHYFAASLGLLTIQEIPTVFIDHAFGREALGHYRFFYDLCAAVWFVATIYPTVLFSSLLPKGSQFNLAAVIERVRSIGNVLILFHLSYFFAVCLALGASSMMNFDLFDAQSSYSIALVGAVSILGYNRFLIEANQAIGKSRAVFRSVGVSALLVGILLLLCTGSLGTYAIGIGWMIGQLFLCIALTAIFDEASGRQSALLLLRTLVFAALPVVLAFIAQTSLSNREFLSVMFVATVAGLALTTRLGLHTYRTIWPNM